MLTADTETQLSVTAAAGSPGTTPAEGQSDGHAIKGCCRQQLRRIMPGTDPTSVESKLTQMHFGLELDRRLRTGRSTVTSLVAHPGGATDSQTPSRPPVHVRASRARLRGVSAVLLLQGKHAGAWPAVPAVRAVLDPDVRGGHLWGRRVLGLRGKPRQEPVWNHLTDAWSAARLWEASCDLSGFGLGTFPGQPHSTHTSSGEFETATASMTAPPPQ